MEDKQIEQPTPKESNVASIGNQFTKEQIKQFNRQQKRIIFRRRRLAVIFAVALVIFVLSGFNLLRSYQRINDLNKAKAAAEATQAELTTKVASLEYDVKLLEDPVYLQKLARQKYFYTKEGELVFSIPQINPNSRGETKADESTSSETTQSSN